MKENFNQLIKNKKDINSNKNILLEKSIENQNDFGIIDALNKIDNEDNSKRHYENNHSAQNENIEQDRNEEPLNEDHNEHDEFNEYDEGAYNDQIYSDINHNLENKNEDNNENEISIKKKSSKCAIQLNENIKNPDRLLVTTNPNFKDNYNINNTGSSKNVENLLDINFTTGKFSNMVLDPQSNIPSENRDMRDNVYKKSIDFFQNQIPMIIERISKSKITDGFIKNKYKEIVDSYCFNNQ